MSERRTLAEWPTAIILFFSNLLVFSQFMAVIGLANAVALELHVPPEHTGFFSSAYSLSAALFTLFAAPFADRGNRKHWIIAAQCLFMFSMLIASLANSLPTFLFSRVLTGVSGGILVANNFAYCGDRYSDQRRPIFVAFLVTAFAGANIAGVPLGLWVAKYFSWRGTFQCYAAIATLLIAAQFWYAEIAGSETQESLAAAFVQYKKLLLSPVGGLCSTVLLAMLGLFGTFSVIGVFYERNLGATAQHSANAFLIAGIFSFIGASFAARLLLRLRGEYLMLFGWGLALATMCWHVHYPPSDFRWLWLGIGMTLFGTAFGFSALRALSLDRVPANQRGRISAIIGFCQDVGTGLGGAWPTLVISSEATGPLHGMKTASWIGLLAFLPIILATIPSLRRYKQVAISSM